MKLFRYVLCAVFLIAMQFLVGMESDDFSLNKEKLVKCIKDRISTTQDCFEYIDWEEELPHHSL